MSFLFLRPPVQHKDATFPTHRSRLNTVCDQRSTATPPPSDRAADIVLAQPHSTIWKVKFTGNMKRLTKNKRFRTTTLIKAAPPTLCDALLYLSPFLIASSGEQETVSGQLVGLSFLLSRNQPESTRPRTWASVPSCASWLATRSMFSSTPVPPALQQNRETTCK